MRLTTIDQHILAQQRRFPGVSGEFSGLLYDVALAAKLVSKEVNRAGLGDLLGSLGEVNVQGEIVQRMDKFANELFIRILSSGGRVCAIATEENEQIVEIRDERFAGKYAINMDPLDGSSNIDVNASIGTIFSIHRRVSEKGTGSMQDLLQPGRRQVAAGYVIYGSSTLLVYTTGHGVHCFTLDPTIGEFRLNEPNARTPAVGKYYSINESNYGLWTEGYRRAVQCFKGMDHRSAVKKNARYIGSLVADFHRNLISGGVFMYPADPKSPRGKLRLLYEAAPLAMVAEQAGGAASDGCRPILDIEPTELHERTPLVIGSRDDVAFVEKMLSTTDGSA